MGIPRLYRQSGEGAVASYNFVDLVQGVGYRTFYGIKTVANTYLFTSDTTLFPNDNDQQTDFALPNGAIAKVDEVNFDLQFKRLTIVEGKVFFAATITLGNGSSNSPSGYLKVRLLHVNGSTETVIGAQQTSDTELTNPAADSWRILMDFDVTRKVFRPNEIFRVEVEIWGQRGSVDSNMGLYHDATNSFTTAGSNTPANPSTLTVTIPFKIDL